MPGTLWKNIIRLIMATKSRFFSLTAIVAIGVAFFVGVSGASPIMGHSVDAYDDETGMKDITIYSNYGFDEDDLEAIRNTEGVKAAEGMYFADVLGTVDQETYITRIHSYRPDQKLNQVVLRTGRLPENKYEALAENGTTLQQGFPLGSTVTFSYPEGTTNESLLIDHVTVVGTIDTPLYMNMTKENSTLSNQYIRTYLYVPEDAFDQSYYLEVNVLADGAAELYAFDQSYEDHMEVVKEEIEKMAEDQQGHRLAVIKDDAMEEYNKGLKEYEDGKKKFEDEIRNAEDELADGEKEILDGEKELDKAEKELLEGIDLLNQSEADARRKLKEAEDKLKESRKLLEEQERLFEQTKKDLADKKKEIEDGIVQLNQAKDGLKQIDDGLKQLDEGIGQLERPETTALIDFLKVLPGDIKLQDVKESVDLLKDLRKELTEQYPELNEVDVYAIVNTAIEAPDDIVESYEYITGEQTRTVSEYLQTLDPETPLDQEDMEYREQIDQMTARLKEYLPSAQINTVSDLLQAYELGERVLGRAMEVIDRETFRRLMDVVHTMDEDTKKKIIDLDLSDFSGMISQLSDLSGMEIGTFGDLVNAYEKGVGDLKEQRDDVLSKRKEITDALAEKGIGENDIDKTIRQMQDGLKEIDDGIKKGEQALKDGRKQLEDGERQLEEGKRELERQIEEGRKKLRNGSAEIARNRDKLNDAKDQLADGLSELQKAKEEGLDELNEAWEKLVDAKKEIDKLEPGEWTILDRKSHYASVTYGNTVDQMKAIGNIFPVFFILVAALVCLTTMTRMVDEQRGEIGILRALGYSKLQCAGKYLIYAGAATVTGTIIGIIAGMMTFPIIIYETWKLMYILPPIKLLIPWNLIALSSISFLGGMLLTTWLACRSDMQEVPSQLMRPKAPKLGKNTLLERIPVIWNQLTFTWKVTMRNIIRYKRRFFMTVAGVAGCAALLVTGFGIRDSINSMVDIQFYNIYQYDGAVHFRKSATPEEMEALRKEYSDKDEISLASVVRMYSGKVKGNSELEDTASVEVYAEADLVKECYDLRTRIGKEPITINDEGAVISEKLAERMEVGIGDVIHLEGEDSRIRDVKITGITEMYIRHYVFMTEAGYEKVFGYLPETRSMLVKINGDQEINEKIQKQLVEEDVVDGIEFYDMILDNFNNMVKGLNAIVWTLIVSSMSLAFVVLGNLINVNISERQREIATLKVLGFRKGEVRSYIYKENNVLTMIGALTGLPLGTMLHHYIMRMVEMEYVMFGREVLPMSYVQAVFLTVLFGVLVDHFMAKKLSAIQMVESLKSVE